MTSNELARLFDLVPSTRLGSYVVRANYSEVAHARAMYFSMRYCIAQRGKDAEDSRFAMDGWLVTCNEIIDLHHIRKPLTRGAA